MPLRSDDTIVACATAPGRGAIAIVRLSGGNALAIARRVARSVAATPRSATLTALHAPDQPDQLIDHGLVTWFEGPHSYTGEDVVEFAVHGGALVSTLVVEACVTAGARPAIAGEYTERAVLNGKLDLVQAEAVADLIDARSRAAHRAAVRQLDGALSKRLTAMREALLQVDALLAYDIDFPEEDEAAPSRARVLAACDDAIGQVDRLLATLPAAALGRDGALVVLAGPPNAGKSALLNALVGEARVIVSEIPGTTRDAVEVLVDDTPYPLRLVDTAGLRESGDRLERLGIEVSERYVSAAHVVLACAETSESLGRTVAAVAGMTAGVVIPVLTKADVLTATDSSQRHRESQRATEDYNGYFLGGVGAGLVRVSAFTGEGLELLRAAIRSAVTSRVAAPGDDTPIVTRARHSTALGRSGEELRAFRVAWAAGALPAPVAATHLRAAVTALEELIGAVDVEDVLERVFRSFCVGK
ncbi:MAG: tRNA uridine-5-carboxymethylaminomethyl(34) synthesis GTPase MnmE [Gemmatimonadaceae bacterium]